LGARRPLQSTLFPYTTLFRSITDGHRFIFCRFSTSQWIEEAPIDTGAPAVARFLRLLLTFHRPPLLAEPLVEKFGAGSPITFETDRKSTRLKSSHDQISYAAF